MLACCPDASAMLVEFRYTESPIVELVLVSVTTPEKPPILEAVNDTVEFEPCNKLTIDVDGVKAKFCPGAIPYCPSWDVTETTFPLDAIM
jgi:hypothetical protein